MVAAARAGQSLEQMKASITLDEYRDWGSYADWRELDIEGVCARVALQRRGNRAHHPVDRKIGRAHV